jgi:predicted nuclease of restriction endonuclease-like RecB superfamily
VFDDPLHVPIVTPITQRVQLPIGVRSVLFVSVRLLTEDERQRMVRHLVARFDIEPEEVESELATDPDHAVPLLAEDVSILVEKVAEWLRP